MPTIRRVISDKATYRERSSQVLEEEAPDVSDKLKEKFRWLQGVVKNATDFDLNVSGNYLDSGRFVWSPGFLGSFDLGTFTGCNGENTIATGFAGGVAYKLELDENQSFNFSIGFTNPAAGPFTAGVVKSTNPKDGYKDSKSEGGSIQSELYEAKDTNGKTVRFRINITAGPGQHPEYQITMSRYSE